MCYTSAYVIYEWYLKGLGANFFWGAGDCSREELGAELDLFDFLSLLGSRLKYFLTSASSLFSNLHSLGLTTSFSASCLNLSSSYIKKIHPIMIIFNVFFIIFISVGRLSTENWKEMKTNTRDINATVGSNQEGKINEQEILL